MGFLLNHWHCLLPVIGIAGAVVFMRDSNKDKKGDHNTNHHVNVIPQNSKD